MVQYHYRLFDRYRVPVETIAFFTGDTRQARPPEFRYEGITTSIHFRYLSYHILDHSEAELLAMGNPFALVVLACQKSLLEGKIPDSLLNENRLTIARTLLKYQYPKDKILSFLAFLKNFLYIDNQEINRNFDTIIDNLTQEDYTMGVIETIKFIEREKGKLEGKLEGKQEGRHEQSLAIARELKKEGLSMEFIAKTTGLALEVVEKL